MIEIGISSNREGILTKSNQKITFITDQQVSLGDVLVCKLYKNANNNFIRHHVDEIIESRPGKGDWPNASPPTFYNIKYHTS